jgi:hypothetical protein
MASIYKGTGENGAQGNGADLNSVRRGFCERQNAKKTKNFIKFRVCQIKQKKF